MSAQVVVLSLAAAVLYALASVLQQTSAATVAPERSMRPSLIVALVRRPRWLLGNLADVAAYGLQFVALRRGSLVVVQTVLVGGLLFALPLGAAMAHRRLRRKEWLGVVAVVVGLSVFLGVGLPETGTSEASSLVLAVSLGLGSALVLALVLTAPGRPGKARAAHLGAGCGVLFGLTAALTKASGHLLDGGLLHGLWSWEPWVLLGMAAVGFLLAQSAFQAGPLDASLPLLTIADPVVAALIGVVAFHEHLSADPQAVLAEVAAVVAMIWGVTVLTRSPLVALGTATPAS